MKVLFHCRPDPEDLACGGVKTPQLLRRASPVWRGRLLSPSHLLILSRSLGSTVLVPHLPVQCHLQTLLQSSQRLQTFCLLTPCYVTQKPAGKAALTPQPPPASSRLATYCVGCQHWAGDGCRISRPFGQRAHPSLGLPRPAAGRRHPDPRHMNEQRSLTPASARTSLHSPF